MKRPILTILFAVAPLLADENPPHYFQPSVCSAPVAPTPGQPGYGPVNPLAGGIYWDPTMGAWVLPDGLYPGSDSDRDVEIATLITSEFEAADVDYNSQRPAWTLFDMMPDGTWYWEGGYWNGHYYGEGYYLTDEIY